MFKKHLILLLLCLPLLFFLIIGYPIEKNSTNSVHTSQRCFAVGNMQEYIHCFKSNKTINGVQLIFHIAEELDSVQHGFGIILFTVLSAQVGLLILLI